MSEILLTVQNFPPSQGGTALLLYDVLRHFPEDSIVSLSGPDLEANPSGQSLPFLHSYVRVLGGRRATLSALRRAPSLCIPLIVSRIVRLARKHRVRRIYAHYPNAPFLIAAYQAARLLRLPLAVYFDILWEERGEAPRLASRYERRIVHRADRRFAITESAVEHLTRKHGLPFELMPHTIDTQGLAEVPHALPAGERQRRIHFAGSIYAEMNLDALSRLSEVIGGLDLDCKLQLYTPSNREELLSLGMRDGVFETAFASRAELLEIQGRSDILYLPQAFHSNRSEMIRHNFPTKALEYMLARRPILVHSPKGSYLTESAREHGYGLIVDTPDRSVLRDAVVRLLEDESLQRELVAKGVAFARSRDSRVWARRFYAALAETPTHASAK